MEPFVSEHHHYQEERPPDCVTLVLMVETFYETGAALRGTPGPASSRR